jgi:hypothetical protein
MLLPVLTLFAARPPQFRRLLLGEWRGTISRNRSYFTDVFADLSIEFHTTRELILTEGTIWRDDIRIPEFLEIEAYLIAHLEIEWESDTLGHVFTMVADRKHVTHVDFRPVIGEAIYSATAKISPLCNVDIRVINQSYVRATANPGSLKYEIRRLTVADTKGESFSSWFVIAAVSVALQIQLCTVFRRLSRRSKAVVNNETKKHVGRTNNTEKQKKRRKAD